MEKCYGGVNMPEAHIYIKITLKNIKKESWKGDVSQLGGLYPPIVKISLFPLSAPQYIIVIAISIPFEHCSIAFPFANECITN